MVPRTIQLDEITLCFADTLRQSPSRGNTGLSTRVGGVSAASAGGFDQEGKRKNLTVRSRGDILTGEYRPDLVYFCQDGAYYGIEEQKIREQHWWALIAQPGATMTWPIVMFHGEYVWFEWICIDDDTNETLAKGSCVWIRRGHRGGCNFKGEQLTFYRDVFSSPELLELITRS